LAETSGTLTLALCIILTFFGLTAP
jgi:hypothetical protein